MKKLDAAMEKLGSFSFNHAASVKKLGSFSFNHAAAMKKLGAAAKKLGA